MYVINTHKQLRDRVGTRTSSPSGSGEASHQREEGWSPSCWSCSAPVPLRVSLQRGEREACSAHRRTSNPTAATTASDADTAAVTKP